MRSKSVPHIAKLFNSSRAGDTRRTRKKDQPMNARTEQIEETGTEEDGNFTAASEVEAGIRDFVRNDIAYLRRPVSTPIPEAPPLDPGADAAVNNVNSLIQRVAGTSLSEIEN